MDASRAATGIFEVFAIRIVRLDKGKISPGINQFRKFGEDIRHLVTAFPTPDIYNDLRVGPLGKCLF